MPPVLTLSASADAVLAGQRWSLQGTLTPAHPGDRVIVTVRRAGVTVLSRRLRVAHGRFHLAVRFRRPGALTIVAAQGTTSSAPVRVAVDQAGRLRPGCGFRPVVAGTLRRRPARLGDRPLSHGIRLGTGARATIPRGSRLRLTQHAATYVAQAGEVRVECEALRVVHGGATAVTRSHGRAQLLIGRAVALLRRAGRLVATAAPAEVRYRRGTGFVAGARAPTARVRAIAGDDVLIGAGGLPRLSTWPFPRSPDQRSARRSDHLPAFWADGRPCSVGCRPAGARTGWPLKPFHRAHPLRSGLNELRPANLHIGIDIQTTVGTPVYAIQAGTAHIAARGTSDIHVGVGNYEYWHVQPAVPEGGHVRAGAVVGRVIFAARHLHLSEVRGGTYLNPLRPGGRVLKPWSDHQPPIIGPPHRAGTTVFDEVFDPQTLRVTLGFRTPVLAPSAVAWRARDAAGHALTPLEFAYRGSQHYPTSAKSAIYGPGSHAPDDPAVRSPGWLCFDTVLVCVPKWNYRLAGVPSAAAAISVYAWDWAGNESVLDSLLR
jgi:murein DD-endopeptidase MepM/ murein hydrolase activator NlpD